MTTSLTVVAVVTGRLETVEAESCRFAEGIAGLAKSNPDIEYVLVVDGPAWANVLPPAATGENLRSVVLEAECSLPGVLANAGCRIASTELVAFVWPGCGTLSASRQHRRLAALAQENDDPIVAAATGPGWRRLHPTESWLSAEGEVPHGFPAGWLKLADLVPMHAAIVRRGVWAEVGGFPEAAAFQSSFWWRFCLEVSKRGRIMADAEPAEDILWTWHHFPFGAQVGDRGDLAARRAMKLFDDASAPPPLGATTARARPLRVTVLGGVNEPAHNQLCFFNYFELPECSERVEWRSVLDTACSFADLAASDLVIFSRIKSEPGCRLMDMCRQMGVPTVYMIDDNWLCIGQEYELYRNIFKPGAPLYEHFLYCASRADVVLTYNPLLAEDMEPYSKDVKLLETNVKLSLFNRRERRPNAPVMVGYVGSARTDHIALEALCALIAERDDLKLMFMSSEIPDFVEKVPEERRVISHYMFDYQSYANFVCASAPDILLAPLGETRFEQSKCPNKYLEISAVGAAGIYSDVPLYRRFIDDGVNGVLVPENTTAAWTSAISDLVENRELRARISNNALKRVEAQFDTPVRLPGFMSFIESVAR